jgi:light-harvesting protein B-800-850 alpha chain
MNEGRFWTVVKPNDGVPLLLGGVAVISMLIHFAILGNSTWFAAFMQGGVRAPVAATAPAP